MSDALDRARADLAAGNAWRSRDRLSGVLTHRHDDEVLELLARVHLEMGDLPSAGALLFVLRRGDSDAATPDERAAIEAWRQRFGNEDARWRSIPAPVRLARADELAELRPVGRSPAGAQRDLPAPDAPVRSGVVALAGCLLVVLVVLVTVALVAVGAVTVASWLL